MGHINFGLAITLSAKPAPAPAAAAPAAAVGEPAAAEAEGGDAEAHMEAEFVQKEAYSDEEVITELTSILKTVDLNVREIHLAVTTP